MSHANEAFFALSATDPSMPERDGIEDHNDYLTLRQNVFLKYAATDVPHAKALELFCKGLALTTGLNSH